MVKISRKSTEERKEEIVKATLDLIGEKGIESLRTSEIADRVGFSEAALYKHFSTKEEIIKATIRTAGERIIDSLLITASEAETENELEKLRKVLETHLSFVQKEPGISRLLFSDEVHFNKEELRNQLLDIINKYQDFVKKLIKKGVEKGQVREDLDIESVSTVYLGLIQSQILFWSLSGGEKSLDERADALLNLLRKIMEAEGQK